tara:strand:- start:8664 stop:8945 length:282 start_codon:yes stop_codon:yes gene_type:complete
VVVQSCHAAIEAAHGLIPQNSTPSLVLCGVRDESELFDCADYLDGKGIRFKTFVEPDIGDQHTALATEPLCAKGRSFLKKFKLLKEEDLMGFT